MLIEPSDPSLDYSETIALTDIAAEALFGPDHSLEVDGHFRTYTSPTWNPQTPLEQRERIIQDLHMFWPGALRIELPGRPIVRIRGLNDPPDPTRHNQATKALEATEEAFQNAADDDSVFDGTEASDTALHTGPGVPSPMNSLPELGEETDLEPNGLEARAPPALDGGTEEPFRPNWWNVGWQFTKGAASVVTDLLNWKGAALAGAAIVGTMIFPPLFPALLIVGGVMGAYETVTSGMAIYDAVQNKDTEALYQASYSLGHGLGIVGLSTYGAKYVPKPLKWRPTIPRSWKDFGGILTATDNIAVVGYALTEKLAAGGIKAPPVP